MKIKIFTVYDSKAELYMQPFFAQSTGAAVRAFQDTCQNPDHVFCKHPSDFTLFEIGIWDDAMATMKLYDAKTPLGSAIEYVNRDMLDDVPELKLG